MAKPIPKQKERVISWFEIQGDIDLLAERLPRNCKIWGIPRNGLIIAGLLSHCRPDAKIILETVPPKSCIIIDDIHDSGETARIYMKKGYKVFTIYWRQKEGNCRPDSWVKTITHKDWLKFPWEKE